MIVDVDVTGHRVGTIEPEVGTAVQRQCRCSRSGTSDTASRDIVIAEDEIDAPQIERAVQFQKRRTFEVNQTASMESRSVVYLYRPAIDDRQNSTGSDLQRPTLAQIQCPSGTEVQSGGLMKRELARARQHAARCINGGRREWNDLYCAGIQEGRTDIQYGKGS